MFQPRLDILPQAQRRLWQEFADTPPEFILYGGTAIALRLGHRQSVDFDFFSFTERASLDLLREVSYLRGSVVLQAAPGTVTVRVNRGAPVKVSFFGPLDMGQVDRPDAAAGPGVPVATLRDLGGVKAAVVTQRVEAKDYVDIHALLRAGLTLPEMLAAAGAISKGEFNPLVALKAIAYHEDLGPGDLSESVRRDLVAAVKSVDARRLPVIEPYRRRSGR